MEQLIRETPITPHIFLENMVTVANGARSGSLVPLDMLNPARFRGTTVRELKNQFPLLKQVVRDSTGLGMLYIPDPRIAIVTSGTGKVVRIAFYRGREAEGRLKELQERCIRFQENATGAHSYKESLHILEMEGECIGIPACCITRFSLQRRSADCAGNENAKQESILQKKLRVLAPTLEDVATLPRETLLPFWAYEVYPCSLDCEASRRMGETVLGCFGDERIARVYQEVVMRTNVERIHSPEALTGRSVNEVHKRADYSLWNKRITEALKQL